MMSTEATRANIPTAPGGAHAAGDHAVPTRSPRNGQVWTTFITVLVSSNPE